MPAKPYNIFLSHSSEDAFEASLLQVLYEVLMKDIGVKVWTYQRDQKKDEKQIAESIKKCIRGSIAVIFLVSPSTLDGGATQWMELAYSDAFGVPTFILLHHLTYRELKNRESGVPPLLLAGQCNEAMEWKLVESRLREIIGANDA